MLASNKIRFGQFTPLETLKQCSGSITATTLGCYASAVRTRTHPWLPAFRTRSTITRTGCRCAIRQWGLHHRRCRIGFFLRPRWRRVNLLVLGDALLFVEGVFGARCLGDEIRDVFPAFVLTGDETSGLWCYLT